MNADDLRPAVEQVAIGVGPFSDAELERVYQHDYFRRSRRTVRIAIALALILYASFAVLDGYIVPEVRDIVWLVRFAAVCPVLLAAFLFTFTTRFERYLELVPAIVIMVGGAGIIVMTAVASQQGATVYYAGLLLAIAWAHSLARLSFRNATAVSIVMTLAYEVVAIAAQRTPGTLLLNNTFFLVSANAIGMFASYRLELAFRRDFLQRRLLVERGRELQAYADRLQESERRLGEIQAGLPQSFENLPRWAGEIATELKATLGASGVGVWRIANGVPVALCPSDSDPPTAAQLKAGAEITKDSRGRIVVPLAGLSGTVFGAIVVSAPSRWDAAERRLVVGFARYLGGALEILEMRRELAEAEAKRNEAHERMRQRGENAMGLCPTCGRCFDESKAVCDVDGSRLLLRLLPYRFFGRYQLTRLIGQGGMGQVFLARDQKLARDVAIKVLIGEALPDAEVRAQLEREARVVARIAHPGVVDVYDLGELDDGSAFIVMEFLTGRSLADQLQVHGRGTTRQVASLVRQVAAALSAAHRAGVVHRDLKPQNVFLISGTEGFTAKLLDFGIARLRDTDARTLSGEGELFGTPAYMAPEQAFGTPADTRSDFYSFAAVAFEALTGERLVWPRPSMAATLVAVMNETPVPVSSLVSGLPTEVDEMFARALAKEPEARPADIEVWAGALADLLDAAEPTTPGWPEPITTEQPALPQVPLSPNVLPGMSVR